MFPAIISRFFELNVDLKPQLSLNGRRTTITITVGGQMEVLDLYPTQ